RRPRRLAFLPGEGDVDLQALPARLLAVLVALVDEDGVVVAAAVNGAALEAVFMILDTVIVAEGVMARAGPHEEGIDNDGVADGVSGRVDKPHLHGGGIHVDRRVQDAAAGDGQVPVAGDVDVAAGRPAVVGGHPDVAGLNAGPVAGAPGEAVAV